MKGYGSSVTVTRGDIDASTFEQLAQTQLIAVDTETAGLSWRDDHLALCQLYAPGIDPVLVQVGTDRAERLCRLLADPSIIKVLHFAPFDLHFLYASWRVEVRSIACTKTASRLLWPTLPPADHSLQSLLARQLGIRVEKGSVRTSDWTGELTPAQVEYATDDVRHLPQLFSTLQTQLQDNDLWQTFRAVCDYLPVAARLDVEGYPDPLVY